MQIYKFFTEAMRSPIGVSEPWEIGKTVRVEGPLVPCVNGLHGWPLPGLLNFTAERLAQVSIGDEYVWHGEGVDRKVVSSEMTPVRLIEAYNDRTLRLFAADCAERVLPLFERARPNDDRPRRAIETVRGFANGEATLDKLIAARGAARGAARAAARAAAWGAAWDAATAAAWGAARDAARDAAWAAARDAAWAAERQWQARHLAQMLGLED